MRERAATPDDFALFLAFQEVIGLPPPAISVEAWVTHAMPHSFFLETDDGEVAAYASARGYGTRGDVRQIAVMPAHQRKGFGAELMRRVAARLRAAGCVDWRLEVLSDNAAAIALYRSFGMRTLGHDALFELDADAVESLLAGAVVVDEEVRPLEDEAEVSARFDLPPGKLARMEGLRPGGTVLVLEREEGIVGLARFHPALQADVGIFFPLRARSAADAATLCAACLRGAALPPSVEICVADPPLRQWLVAAGHTPIHERDLMGGELP